MAELQIQALESDRIAQAYPLIQASLPGVSLEAWREFAVAQVQPDRTIPLEPLAGILSVINEEGYIVGLCSYRIRHDLTHGRALIAEHVIALGLFNRSVVAERLATGLEDLARSRACSAIHTTLTQTQPGPADEPASLLGLLRAHGHEVESLRLCKVLAAQD